MIELSKTYEPKDVEQRLYDWWSEQEYFHADENSDKQSYAIVIPPPNVTGVLHMGHALNNTIQDIMIRFKRMQGFNAMWMPGTDHAGIATQNVVEKKLKKEGKTKDDLGREAFLEEVWDWKKHHGDTIIRQLKRLGCSCDWQRERFTMDEGLSEAVRHCFHHLYHKDLIYQGNYIINWCPRCQTALSDEEAEHQDKQGKIYHLRYRYEGSEDYIVLATTRPETMFGDVAVAVNPKDERYSDKIGQNVILPILNKAIPIIADDHVDPEFGTGMVKVTPAHDPNDFEIGLRHNLEPVNVMNGDATMVDTGKYDGLDRFACRKQLIKDLEAEGLLEKIEDHQNSVGHCYRCDTMVEPRLSKQWFVRMKPLAERALKVVEDGEVNIHPERWTKIYNNWLTNIRDWCISRQIWWGHRIPVWHCEDCGKHTVDIKDPSCCAHCQSSKIVQDPDVLDTWFSSWLWPISTLGWPEKTKALETFYPTQLLATAPEILFFWVARMIMAGLEFEDQIPFSDVYLHGTVRDETGTKMSKSLGNTIDPLEIIDQFSADALRFSIIMITAQGQDVYLSKEKFEIGRNFANKLWNAARFILMNIDEGLEVSAEEMEKLQTDNVIDQWIESRLARTIEQVTDSLDKFRYNDAARRLYDFIWHDYCDWYIEMVKARRAERDVQVRLLKILEQALRLLHPIMPFVSEEIWQKLPLAKEQQSIMISAWPEVRPGQIDDEIEAQFALIKDLIQAVRNCRRELGIALGKELKVHVRLKQEQDFKALSKREDIVMRLAKLESLKLGLDTAKPGESTAIVREYGEVYIELAGVIDLEQERARLAKELEKIEKELGNVSKKLSNENFVSRAPEEVVQKEKAKQDKYGQMISQLEEQIASLA